MTQQPAIITEAQAQELANITGCYITSDLFGCALIHGRTPKKGITSWHSPFFTSLKRIKISSTRPWTEQIWRPE